MKTYERPIVLLNEELAEGVYAASGAVSDDPYNPEPTPGGESGNNPEATPAPGGSGAETEVGSAVTTDCWTVDPVSVQDWNGSQHVFEIRCAHSNSVEHISSNTEVVLTFSSPVTDASSEFPCTFSGNTVTINRTLLADAYQSGDNMTYKVWVKAGDEATTKSISCVNATISCTHETNVQGKYD